VAKTLIGARRRRSSAHNASRTNSIGTTAIPSYTEVAVRVHVKRIILLAALAARLTAGNGNSWNKLRYSGGTVPANVNPYDWNTTLTVSSDNIVLMFAHRTSLSLAPSQITGLSYGEQAYHRVADMVTLSIVFVNPLMLFGILHQSRNHFIGIEFRGTDGKSGAVLLEADKNIYQAILKTLTAVTGKPVAKTP
jgi:hypothetical protein